MSEIQWLVDILMQYKLPDPVKQKFISRIGEVEAALHKGPVPPPIRPLVPMQVPSTQRLLEDMAQQTGAPVEIAQTPAAAQALQQRQATIAVAISGKPEAGRTSPRKF